MCLLHLKLSLSELLCALLHGEIFLRNLIEVFREIALCANKLIAAILHNSSSFKYDLV